MKWRQYNTIIVTCIIGLIIGTSVVPAFNSEIIQTISKKETILSTARFLGYISSNNDVHNLADKMMRYNAELPNMISHQLATLIDGEEWDIVVPDDYDTIQGAVNAVEDGYRIFVRSGVYLENINIYLKSSITLHGESKETTIIDGSGFDDVIEIEDTADGINISGFTIKNSGCRNHGILISSNYNIIQDNSIKDNKIGIKIQSSSGNQIWNNDIVDNSETGILLDRSYANNITGNKIVDNGNNGIKFTYSSLGSTLDDNEISSHNDTGVYLDESSLGNMFTRCTIKDNRYGVFCTGVSDGNIFQQNAFIENTGHAFDGSLDQWDYLGFGNYWDDYTGVDCDGDGVGDTPYNVPGGVNIDHYPLMNLAMIFDNSISTNFQIDYDNVSSTYTAVSIMSEIIVPDDYDSIQEAVNHANPGDSIFVRSGIYHETVNISTPDLRIYGEDKESAIIDGGGDGHVFFVNETADGLNISGLTIESNDKHFTGLYLFSDYTVVKDIYFTDCNIGISLRDNTNNIIQDCQFSNNNYGIWAWMCSNSTFTDNEVENNVLDGIALQWSALIFIFDNSIVANLFDGILEISCSKIELYNNTISENDEFGIQIFSSNDNIINGNFVSLNDGDGIAFSYSTRNILLNNIVSHNNDNGLSFLFISSDNKISGNTISNNLLGIFLDYSSYNTINGNNIKESDIAGILLYSSSDYNMIIMNNISHNNYNGIYLYSTSDNTINDNNINFNIIGISLYVSSDNTINGNNIIYNDEGIYFYASSENNVIYRNIFLKNIEHAYDEGKNIWDDSKFGNYWDDYREKYPDASEKLLGVWDTPYNIQGGDNMDRFPFISSNSKTKTEYIETYPFIMRFVEMVNINIIFNGGE